MYCCGMVYCTVDNTVILGTPTIACKIDSIVYKCMYLFRAFTYHMSTFGGDFNLAVCWI